MKHYQNLDLELFDYRRDETGERFRARVLRAPGGEEMADDDAAFCQVPVDLRATVQRLADDRLELPELIGLGESLGELLLPAGLPRKLWDHSVRSLARGGGLRLRLRSAAPQLASLPWELAYIPLPRTPATEKDARGFLALNERFSLVRHEVLDAPATAFEPVDRPRLVCLLSGAALPGISPLGLAKERQGIRAAVEPSGIELVEPEKATLAGLQRCLDGGAHLFHYAGHGQFEERMGEIPRTSEGKGYLLLEGTSGGPLLVPADQVGLNLTGAGVRLAVLNGCETGRRDAARSWTGIAPLLVQEGIPAVVANQFQIRDATAIELARRFYEKLATGEPVDAAVAAARLAVSNLDGARPRDFATPVLYLRLAEDSDGVLLPPARTAALDVAAEPKPNPWFWINLPLLAALVTGIVPWLAHRYLDIDLLLGAGSGVVALFAAWGIVDRLAGDHVNASLGAWLHRRVAVIWLAGLLAAGGAAGALAPPPAPIVLLLPFDGLVSRLPNAAPSACELRLSVDGQPVLVVGGLKREAVFVGASEAKVEAALAGDILTTELLALRPTGERQAQREQFYRTMLGRRRIESVRLAPGQQLRLEVVERLADGTEKPLYSGERWLKELEGRSLKVWFLEGASP